MFTPVLSLIRDGERQTLIAITEVPSEAYAADGVRMGSPEQAAPATASTAVRLELRHSPEPVAQRPVTIEHRLRELALRDGETVIAYVMLEGRILGSGGLVFSRGRGVATPPRTASHTIQPIFRATAFTSAAATRPPLTSQLCQDITVRNTPDPSAFTGPTQTLDKLGVIDDAQTRIHKSGIQDDLNHIGWHIQQADIESGPAKQVRDCSNSVENNAF